MDYKKVAEDLYTQLQTDSPPDVQLRLQHALVTAGREAVLGCGVVLVSDDRHLTANECVRQEQQMERLRQAWLDRGGHRRLMHAAKIVADALRSGYSAAHVKRHLGEFYAAVDGVQE